MTPPARPPPGPDLRRLGWIVLAVSFGLRAVLAWRGGQFFWPDEDRFVAAQQAARLLADGHGLEAARLLFAQPDHLLFKLASVVPAGLELALGAPAWVPALCFAAVSTWVLWLVAQAARAAGGSETEGFVALLLAAGSSALFYYSRHYFPYDLSLGCLLLALITSLRGPPGWRTSLRVGGWAGLGFLVYNGYWSLTAAVLLAHVLAGRPAFRVMLGRAAEAGLGALLPVMGAIVIGRMLGHDLLTLSVQFAGTVTQGDLGRAWEFVPRYFWATERGLAVLWLLALTGALLAGLRAGSRALFWPLFSLLLLALLIGPSDLFHRFALSARHVRVLAPFLCLAAAGALCAFTRPRFPSWLLPAGLALVCVQAGINFATPLRQVFPREFLQQARAYLDGARRHDLGPYAVLNADFLHNPDRVKPAPDPGEVRLRQDHPFQFVPYLFEGYPAAVRERYLRQDLSMRVVRLAVGGPPTADYPAGLLELTLRFPATPFGLLPDPVVATGAAGRVDLVYLQYEDADRIRIGHDHFGGSGALSAPLPLDRGKSHRLLLGLGSFYPPGRNSRLVVLWDGATVFRQDGVFHPATPAQIAIGQNLVGASTAAPLPAFEIEQYEKLTPLAAPTPLPASARSTRLLLFPPDDTRAIPLLGSGRPGLGDLLFLQPAGNGTFRIGHDHHGAGAVYSAPFALAAGQPADLLIDCIPVEPAGAGAPAVQQVFVSCNGRVVFNRLTVFHPTEPGEEVVVGGNTIGSSVAPVQSAAEIYCSFQSSRGAPALAPGDHPGAFRLQLRFFGPAVPGHAEPILSTGRPGAGELLFLRHEADGRLRIGGDIWGRPALWSEPVAYDRDQPLDLVISLGSLFPSGARPDLAGRLFVAVNGRTVLNQPAAFHPAVPGSTILGFNRIGASSAAPTLSADILRYEQILPEEILPLAGPP